MLTEEQRNELYNLHIQISYEARKLVLLDKNSTEFEDTLVLVKEAVSEYNKFVKELKLEEYRLAKEEKLYQRYGSTEDFRKALQKQHEGKSGND